MACQTPTSCDTSFTFKISNVSTPTEILYTESSTSTVNSYAGQLPVPTLSSGNYRYQLRGCYNEIPPGTSGLALGQDGSFYSPVFASPDYLTVDRCLEGCGAGITSNGALGYNYAALKNGRECYCSMTLSSLSVPTLNILCSSTCAGDSSTSCGGPGYLALYELESADISIADIPIDTATITTTTSPITEPSNPVTSSSPGSRFTSPTHSTAPTLQTEGSSNPELSHKAQVGLAVGIAVPVACLGLLILLLVWLRRRRTRRRRADSVAATGLGAVTIAESKASATSGTREETETPATPASSSSKFSSDLVRGGTVKGTIVRGRFTPEDRKRDTFEAWKTGEIPTIIISPATDSDGNSIGISDIDGESDSDGENGSLAVAPSSYAGRNIEGSGDGEAGDTAAAGGRWNHQDTSPRSVVANDAREHMSLDGLFEGVK